MHSRPTSGRHIHLVLENDDNAARFLKPAGGYRAQWNDDYHHAWHVLLTDENNGYYRDYQDAPAHIARTLGEGFAYQGEHSPFRGRARGEPSAHLPRADFVNFLQNHDQIGNRPMGERLTVLAEPAALEAALAVLLLQPGPPLMFMGDEWGATRAVPLLLRLQGRAGASGARRPQARIRRSLCAAQRRNSRSAGGGNARRRHARLGRAQCSPRTPPGSN